MQTVNVVLGTNLAPQQRNGHDRNEEMFLTRRVCITMGARRDSTVDHVVVMGKEGGGEGGLKGLTTAPRRIPHMHCEMTRQE